MHIKNTYTCRKGDKKEMKRVHRILLITASGLIVMGAALGGAALLMGAGSAKDVSYLTETVNAQSIRIYSGYDDIVIESSDSDEITISYPEDRQCETSGENGKFEMVLKNKTFDILEWYKHVDISFKAEKTAVILRLPTDFSGQLTAESAGADIEVSGINAGSMELESRDGNIISENSVCEISAKSTSGDVYISGKGKSASAESEHGDMNVRTAEYEIVSLSSQSGDIEMNDISANAVYLNNNSGEITGESVESGSIDILNDYGDTVLNRIKPGMLRAESRYGDINLGLMGKGTDYSVNGITEAQNRIYINSEYGDVNVEYISE